MKLKDQILGDIESLIIFISIIGLTLIVAGLFKYFVNRSQKKRIKNPLADQTNYQFIRHFITALIYLVGFGWAFLVLPMFKIVAHTFLTGAGIVALVAGLASQQALSNIMSGLFIVIFKPFRLNDRITIREKMSGVVEDITLRHTIIRDLENNRIVVPNAVMGGEILINTHLSDHKVCRKIDVGISYQADIGRALEIMQTETRNHPLAIRPDQNTSIPGHQDDIFTQVLSLGESSVILRVWAWARHEQDALVMEGELLRAIKEQFQIAGIEIPFPQRVVTLKNQ